MDAIEVLFRKFQSHKSLAHCALFNFWLKSVNLIKRDITRFFYCRIQTQIHVIPDYKRHLFYPTKEIKRREAIEKRKHWKLQYNFRNLVEKKIPITSSVTEQHCIWWPVANCSDISFHLEIFCTLLHIRNCNYCLAIDWNVIGF